MTFSFLGNKCEVKWEGVISIFLQVVRFPNLVLVEYMLEDCSSMVIYSSSLVVDFQDLMHLYRLSLTGYNLVGDE